MDTDAIVAKLITALQNEKLNDYYNKIIVEPLREDIKELKSEINSLKQSVKEKEKEITELQQKYENLESTLATNHTEIEQKVITKLNHLLNNKMEQLSKSKNLIIEGIPEENMSGNLHQRVLDTLNDTLSVDLEENDIQEAVRIGKRKEGHPKKVLIKFKTEELKDKVYKKRKLLKNCDQGEFYLNEDLIAPTAELFHKTTLVAKKKHLCSCWTYKGNIYVKEDNTATPTLITSEAGLERFEAWVNLTSTDESKTMQTSRV